MKYVSVAEMVAIEKESDARGHTYPEMMEAAGKGLAAVVRESYAPLAVKQALGLVGSGNNGGDTLVACAYLQAWGWETTCFLVRPRPQGDPLVGRLRQSGGRVLDMVSDPGFGSLAVALESHPVILDGVLGTGMRLPLHGRMEEVLAWIREKINSLAERPHVVAVDCPSGVDCDSGEAAPEVIQAEMTVTMAAVKQGLLKFPAFLSVGDLRCVGIGLPGGLAAYDAVRREIIDRQWVLERLPSRPLDAHKSTFGVVMVLAGSRRYSGAALLAGKAAFRSGAGWVTLAVPEPLHAALAGAFVEATWLPLPDLDGWIAQEGADLLLANLDRVTTLLIGPGFGVQATTGAFLRDVLAAGGLPPLVVDADGLKLMAQVPGWAASLPGPAVLTPHPGEMAVLTGLPLAEIQADRVGTAEKYARQWGHVVVLKGAFTVIAAPDGRTALIPVATPALARAGTGDVLAGLAAGLRAQGLEAFEAAAASAWIHAQAGLRSAEILGSSAPVLAGDVLAAAVEVIADLSP